MTAEQLLENIYSLLGDVVLLPIPKGKKGPDFAGWQKRTFDQSRERRAELIGAIRRGGNIGVLLGPASNRLLALDLDDDNLIDEWLASHPWLANTLRSKGKRGCQFWLRMEPGRDYPNGKAVYLFDAAGRPANKEKAVGELRLGGAGGAQSVIYGLHPEGPRYQILVEKPPLVVSQDDLDELAPGLLFAVKDEPAKPSSSTNGHVPGRSDILGRVIRYLDKCDPAVSGQRGHDTTFSVLCLVVRGFDLSPDQAWEAALHYNRKCEPPWSEKDLKHKVAEALKATANEPRGLLLQGDSDALLEQKLKKEQAQREEVAGQSSDGQREPIDLEKETEERFRQYLSDPEPFPSLMRSEGFHGVIGEIANVMSDHCESSPEVLLVHGLVIVGNILGRSAFVHGGGPKLFPNEFAVFVGETARGRKGTAYYMWQSLAEHVNHDWLAGCLSSNIQSGEGVVHRVRDEHYGIPPGKKKKGEPVEEVLMDAGVSDKRLLIVEEEFSHVLKMAQRSGNSLTETIRKAWDSPLFLKTDNKNSPLKASDPHISLIGHITRQELLDTLKTVDLNNGMANRILWCAARRTGDMPNPEYLDWPRYPAIIDRLQKVFRQRFPNVDGPAFFNRAPDAKNYWDALYRKLNAEKQQSTVDAVLARDTAHILKIALIFAIADQVVSIEMAHLKAALAVIDFCRDSARWIFGKATGNKLANSVLWKLRRTPAGLSREQINEEVCRRNTPKSQLEQALSDLAKNGLAKMNMERGEKGRPVERWFAEA